MTKYLMALYLILSAAVISAQNWCFERNDELLNPYNIHTKGMNTPFTGDFDDDGDYDLIVGCRGGVLQYYENIGTPDSAIWRMDEDYFSTVELDTAYAPQPSLVDLDGDGLAELYTTFAGWYGQYSNSEFRRYLNYGSRDDPMWGRDWHFDIGSSYDGYSCHQFVDFDHDNDFDLLFSGYDRVYRSHILFFENIGNSELYSFQVNNDIFDSLDYEYTGEFFSFHLQDVIGDEKYELFVIPGYWEVDLTDVIWSNINCYKNNGSIENPVWDEIPFDLTTNFMALLTFCDLDNDSDQDIILGHTDPPIFFNENIGDGDTLNFRCTTDGEFLGNLYINYSNSICINDFDNDSDIDFSCFRTYISPNYWFMYDWSCFENSGSMNQPYYMPQDFMPWYVFYSSNPISISAGDLNGDSLPEIIHGFAPLRYYINQCDRSFDRDIYGTITLDDASYYQNPELADLNNDGLTDLIVRHRDDYSWMFYENTGDQYEPQWTSRSEWLFDAGYQNYKLRAAYLNFDNLIDLVGGDNRMYLCAFINTGSTALPQFSYDPQVFASLEDYRVRYYDCADIDGDHDDDIIINANNLITVIENKTTTNITDPEPMLPENTALLQNYPNPFNASTVISFTLDQPGKVTLTVYDILGREVETLIDGTIDAGKHSIIWNVAKELSSGIYFCSLNTNDNSDTKQMVYVK